MHVAIIMDGNGRSAERRGLRRTAGHRAGARAVRRVVEAAARSEVDVLTLYAFSSDNWSRPVQEVRSLMSLLKHFLRSEVSSCVENGVRVNVICRRDRLRPDLTRVIEQAERMTVGGRNLLLQLAIDYSAREAILRAAAMPGAGLTPALDPADTRSRHPDEHPAVSRSASIQRFAERIADATHSCVRRPSVDLLIRTGGEYRLSDFLLWECAYAELVFVDECWPDFDESAFYQALEEFQHRERRFGGLARPSAHFSGGAL